MGALDRFDSEDDIPFGNQLKTVVNAKLPPFLVTSGSRLSTMGEGMDDLQVTLDKWAAGTITHLPTGFRDIDLWLEDFMDPERLIVIGGRPGMGKTSFAIQIVENIAKSGKNALLFSLEMSAQQINMRNLIRISRVSRNKLRNPSFMTDEEIGGVKFAQDFLRDLPIATGEGSFSIDEICKEAKQYAAALSARGERLDVICIDYLQFIRASDRASSREQEIGEISRKLKGLAKDLYIPIIVLASLNRDNKTRANKRPVLEDLRESGSIESDADVVLLIYRDEMYNADTQEKGVAEIICAKNKDGATGMEKMSWCGERSAFADWNNEQSRSASQPAFNERKSNGVF